MNKPYTCHQCGTEFDLLPDAGPVGIRRAIGPQPEPQKVRVRCPGCYAAGYTGCPGSRNPPGRGDMVYIIDLATMQPV